LRILLGRITEETRTDGFLHPSRILASRYHVQFVPGTCRRTNVRFFLTDNTTCIKVKHTCP
jgi:hypothetical protein